MALEDAIVKLTEAVEANTAALKGAAAPAKTETTTKTETKGKTTETKPKKPTSEDVRAALKAYSVIEGKEGAIALLKEFGADTLNELDPDKYQQVIDKTKA